MTKHRPPLSIDAALARIAGHLAGGWTDIAETTRRAESTVRAWGDPDRPEQIPLDCAVVIDLAYQAAGGLGAPCYEAYTSMLEEAGAERFADQIALGRLASQVIRECGEANAALVAAAQPGATDTDRRRTLREIEEAMAQLQTARQLLTKAPPLDERDYSSPGS